MKNTDYLLILPLLRIMMVVESAYFQHLNGVTGEHVQQAERYILKK